MEILVTNSTEIPEKMLTKFVEISSEKEPLPGNFMGTIP